jgi:hypothetical protein
VLFRSSCFGAENPALTRSVGIGTATSKLIPYEVEPVVAGFRSQEFTVHIKKLDAKGAGMAPKLAQSANHEEAEA